MTSPPPPPRRFRAIAGAVLLGTVLPLGLGGLILFLRPDLFVVMVDRDEGRTILWGAVILSQAATVSYLVSALIPFRTRTTPRVLALLGFLLCTLPALLAIGFGPVIFTFMYGAAG